MEKQRLKPFLTFNGQAEEALNYYASIFPGAKITKLVRYGKNIPHISGDDKNRIMHGALSLLGQEILFLDMDSSNVCPAFNWAFSIYLDCKDESEFDSIFAPLAKDGKVLMGPESVGHIRKCAWITDKFGVTWQPVWE